MAVHREVTYYVIANTTDIYPVKKSLHTLKFLIRIVEYIYNWLKLIFHPKTIRTVDWV